MKAGRAYRSLWEATALVRVVLWEPLQNFFLMTGDLCGPSLLLRSHITLFQSCLTTRMRAHLQTTSTMSLLVLEHRCSTMTGTCEQERNSPRAICLVCRGVSPLEKTPLLERGLSLPTDR